jgi:DNA-binding MarR family transcriptional regulator
MSTVGSQPSAQRPHDVAASCDGGECSEALDLDSFGESDSAATLVAQTTRFATGFLRWMETRAGGGLSYPRLRLLQALNCGGPAIMRDLGTQLETSPRNMTAIVDALEDAHLVVRRRHPSDRRATIVELSAQGAREAEELGPRIDAMSEIFAALSDTERRQFSSVLAKLTRAIQDRQGPC